LSVRNGIHNAEEEAMKVLQGAAQTSGYLETLLVDPEDLDLLRLEETGELVEGLDFAVFWDGD
jgi:hypothetical protein